MPNGEPMNAMQRAYFRGGNDMNLGPLKRPPDAAGSNQEGQRKAPRTNRPNGVNGANNGAFDGNGGRQSQNRNQTQNQNQKGNGGKDDKIVIDLD